MWSLHTHFRQRVKHSSYSEDFCSKTFQIILGFWITPDKMYGAISFCLMSTAIYVVLHNVAVTLFCSEASEILFVLLTETFDQTSLRPRDESLMLLQHSNSASTSQVEDSESDGLEGICFMSGALNWQISTCGCINNFPSAQWERGKCTCEKKGKDNSVGRFRSLNSEVCVVLKHPVRLRSALVRPLLIADASRPSNVYSSC